MNFRNLRIAIAIIVLLIAVSFVSGCGKPAPERIMLVGCDNSGSVKAEGVKQYTSRILEPIVEEENGTKLKMYLFTHRPEVVFESRVSEIEDLYGTIDKYVIGNMSTERYTLYCPIMEKWIAEARSNPKAKVFGILLTDGDCFDKEYTTAMARELASEPNFVVLYVAPVRNGAIRSEIEHTLYPLKDSHKLIISGENDIAGAIAEFQRKEKDND